MSECALEKRQDSTPAKTQELAFTKPYYEVVENGDYKIRVYMPGVSKENVNIVLDKKTLAIEGIRQRVSNENWRPRYRELKSHNYRLRLELNLPVDEDAISAKTEDGVLELHLPLKEEAKPRKIPLS